MSTDHDQEVQVNMHEAKTQLSKLGKLAWQGKKVVIAKAGKPYLELVPLQVPPSPRKPGRLAGHIWIAPDFDDTPEDVIAGFEGE